MFKGEVDFLRLRELVEFHIQGGTSAIIAAGTTGEAGTLSFDEKCSVIKTVIDAAHERIAVIAGTAANATQECIALTQCAMSLGAHGALIMTPAYIKPTQEGLYQHYQHIADSVHIPIILYNVPQRTACDLLPETVARLSKISNIIGIKEATGQRARLDALLDATEGKIDVYSGDDLTCAEWMLAGAKGVISVAANIIPKKIAKICDAGLDDDHDLCLQLHEQLTELFQQLFIESNPIPIKWAMAKMGLIQNELRLPLTSFSAAYQHALTEVLRSLELV
jgi:4-hydroxy-tetrahydrodipicolinate synthase